MQINFCIELQPLFNLITLNVPKTPNIPATSDSKLGLFDAYLQLDGCDL